MMTQAEVFVRTEFEGFHCWPEAPEVVGFLRSEHRHIFKVEARAAISASRSIEFYIFKWSLNSWIAQHVIPKLAQGRKCSLSCEQIAEDILRGFSEIEGNPQLNEVTVSEDGENGASVYALLPR